MVQVLPLRRCNDTVCLADAAPLAPSCPVIEKDCLTWADEGAEMVRVVEIFAGVALIMLKGLASTITLALQNNNAQITSTTATIITPLFSPNIPPHLER